MGNDIRFGLYADDNTRPGVDSVKRNLDGLGNTATMSAKAIDAAMRNVPAQFTDIVTSIQGGQSALTVLIQQGGQLKDMFGGVAPAAKALGTYMLGLISPTALVGAGVALLTLAYYQGKQEGAEFNKQLALSGNVAGVSTSQLIAMAAAQASVSGTQHEAADILAVLIGTGKIAADQLGVITNAAVSMAKVGGASTKEIVADFVALGEDPVKASAKLNESHHYLTQAVYEQIAALVEQGDKLGAAALAQTTYANASIGAAKQITENMGAIQRSFDFVITGAKKMWDAVLGVGRDVTGSEQLAALKKTLSDREARGPLNPTATNAYEKGNQVLRDQIALIERINVAQDASAKQQGQNAKDQQAAIAATGEIDKLMDRAKGVDAVTKALKEYRKGLDDIRKVNPDSEALKPENQKAAEAQIRKEHMGSVKAPSEAPINAGLEALKSQSEQVERGLKVSQDQIKADYDIGLVSARAYLDEQFELKQNALQKELGIANQQLELAGGKKNIAAAERYKTEVSKINDELAANMVQHATAVDQLAAKTNRAILAYQATLDNAYNTRQQGIDDSLQGAGMGARALEELQRATAVRREYDKRADALRAERAKGESHGGLSQAEYDQELSDLQVYYADRLAQETDFNAKAKALRMDWSVGAKQAVATYLESAQDVAGQTAKGWTDAFSGMGDALLKLEKTGKLSFGSLTETIVTDWLTMQNKLLLAKAATAGSGLLDSVGSFLGFGASNVKANAKGGVYSSASLSDYSNTVVDKPTMFAFAKGTALMGEAGEEAIMPLTRGADGRLGVTANMEGQGASAPGLTVNVTVQQIGSTQAKVETQQTQDPDGTINLKVILRQFDDYLGSNIDGGTGATYRSIKGRFGLGDSLG